MSPDLTGPPRTPRPHGRAALRPFLKWAGGKGQLLDELLPRYQAAAATGRYIEPFLGGGAFFFDLARRELLPHGAALSDTNPNLIEVYHTVRDQPHALIEALKAHAGRHCEAYFYEVRAHNPGPILDRAARVLYLNKTCFNGLYRENSKGKFNVPFGRYTNPTIYDEPNLLACSAALASVTILERDFAAAAADAQPGDFVYFDPPYIPVSASSTFTRYAKGDFGDADQVRLAQVFRELRDRGVHVLLSNSMGPRVRELYADFTVDEVLAGRAINSKGGARGAVAEALVRTF